MSIEPHGGALVNRRVSGEERDRLISEAADLPRIDLDERQIADLDMIAVGAMSPLTGFLGEKDYQSVVADMRLADGTVWPFPISLRVGRELADKVAERAALWGDGKLLAVLDVSEKFEGDKKVEAKDVYGTEDEAHPGVAALYAQGDVMLGGDVHVVDRPHLDEFDHIGIFNWLVDGSRLVHGPETFQPLPSFNEIRIIPVFALEPNEDHQRIFEEFLFDEEIELGQLVE